MKSVRSLALTIAVVLTALPICVTSGLSQDAGSEETLREAQALVTLMSGSVTGMAATGQAWPPLETAIRNKHPRIDEATLAELRKEFTRTQIGYTAELTAEAPHLYARYFTAQELREIAAFYRTPAGAKLLRVLPQVMSELAANELPRLQNRQQQLSQAIERILRARGYTR